MTAFWQERLDRLEAMEDRNEEVDPRALHDEAMERRDRVREYARQPHARERREHRRARQQECDARLALYPDRPVDSQVQPLGRVA